MMVRHSLPCNLAKIMQVTGMTSAGASIFVDKMVKCGIMAILNFAPCKLNVPDGVILENENLALSLAYLNNQIK